MNSLMYMITQANFTNRVKQALARIELDKPIVYTGIVMIINTKTNCTHIIRIREQDDALSVQTVQKITPEGFRVSTLRRFLTTSDQLHSVIASIINVPFTQFTQADYIVIGDPANMNWHLIEELAQEVTSRVGIRLCAWWLYETICSLDAGYGWVSMLNLTHSTNIPELIKRFRAAAHPLEKNNVTK